jgi:NADH-quinone oxidoreductase subunit M
MFSHYLLSLLIWFPILSGLLCIFLGQRGVAKDSIRWVATILSVLTFLLSLPLYFNFDATTWQMQFVENAPWIPAFSANYSLGVDGISVLFILLTCFTNAVIVLSSWRVIQHNVAEFMAIFLISTGIMNGAFSARDALLFYMFWEASMVPMLLGLGIWGGLRRSYAAIKFFLYTFLGSIFLLVAVLYLQHQTGSFDIASFENIRVSSSIEDALFLAFLAAFAVKIPMWPVHTWLPDAHTEAPSGGSVVLAALMLKLGAYGFIRFSFPILPGIHESFDWLLIGLSLIAVIYVGFAALAQKDMKRLIAYSSISHMGLVTLGIFSVFMIVGKTHDTNEALVSVQGAMFQMVAHAFSAGGLFIGVGYLFDRFGSRLIQDYQGLSHVMPIFAAFFMLFTMANVGLPGTSGFVGEFLIIMGVFKANIWIAVGAALTLVIAPAYTLWMYKRVLFGDPSRQKYAKVTGLDISVKSLEFWVFVLLAAPVVVFGVYPEPILAVSHASVSHFVELITSKIAVGAYS